MNQVTFRIWYAVWVGDPSRVFVMRRTKKAAKATIRDGKKFASELKFGVTRLTEQMKTKRRRRRKSAKSREVRKGHLNAAMAH